jgi:hypothetical protein
VALHAERDPLALHNGRVKAFAKFLSTVGVVLIGIALLRLLVEPLANAALAAAWWGLAGFIMHALGFLVLGELRREVRP